MKGKLGHDQRLTTYEGGILLTTSTLLFLFPEVPLRQRFSPARQAFCHLRLLMSSGCLILASSELLPKKCTWTSISDKKAILSPDVDMNTPFTFLGVVSSEHLADTVWTVGTRTEGP